MEFGVSYPARPDAWKDIVIAEDSGFSHAWFYDSQLLYSDIYACMALAAEHTNTIKLGTGVAIPSNRIAPVTAHSIATINLLAPGRTILGIGTGFTVKNIVTGICSCHMVTIFTTVHNYISCDCYGFL